MKNDPPRPVSFKDIRAGMRVRRLKDDTVLDFTVERKTQTSIFSTGGRMWYIDGDWYVLVEAPLSKFDRTLERMARAIFKEIEENMDWDTAEPKYQNYFKKAAEAALKAQKERI